MSIYFHDPKDSNGLSFKLNSTFMFLSFFPFGKITIKMLRVIAVASRHFCTTDRVIPSCEFRIDAELRPLMNGGIAQSTENNCICETAEAVYS